MRLSSLIFSLLLCSFASEAKEKEMTIEEFLQGLSSVPNVITKRDPFVEADPPFQVDTKEVVADVTGPILQRYPLSVYNVVAVLIGDQYPRALVRIPEGKVLIVKEKDRLGSKNGIVTKISKNGVTVLQNEKSPLGFVDKAEVTLPVGVDNANAEAPNPSAPGGRL